ncbi:MAG: ferrous iron transport protein B [Culicoidibacterales bacterium]
MKYILVGNPNVGKTTFFNLLTDSNNKVTNFAGTTVDVVSCKIRQTNDFLVDLPGIRALNHASEDEYIAISTIVDHDFDKIINIIDSVNIKRNLYLSIQLLESQLPIVFILNFKDDLQNKGISFDMAKFATKFGLGKLIVAKKEKNSSAIVKHISQPVANKFILDYGQTLEGAITKVAAIVKDSGSFTNVNSRFIAIQLLSNNLFLLAKLTEDVQTQITKVREVVEAKIIADELALSLNGLFFKIRRAYIIAAMEEVSHVDATVLAKWSPRNKVDAILLNGYFGIPLFLLNFYLIFYVTFLLGNPVSDFFDASILAPFGLFLRSLLEWGGLPQMLISLVVEGAYAGFATVVMFLPQIVIVFVFLSVLEGSGYMSRAVVLFDKTFSKIGLNGKALAPMMIGLGCNVPAIMAARTISNKKERLITQLIIPFISCAARLEIYILFVSLFFNQHQALILLGLNLLGVAVALTSAKIFSLSFFKKQEPFFLVEIPPYRSVNINYISKMTINKVKQFITNAGKFIVIGSIIIWGLLWFGPSGYTQDINNSFFALIGHLFAWAFVPLGFGTWQATSSLITGFLAKELVVAQIGVLLSGYPSVELGITTLFTPAGAVSFMVFNLLYIPCLSTVSVLKQETKSWKWVWFSILYSFVVAYLVAYLCYMISLFLL